MKRIYVAGSYSADNIMDVLNNIRRGIRAGYELISIGYAPFVPWLDHQLVFALSEGEELTLDELRAYSLAWLEVCEAVLVLPDSEKSEGTRAEIKRAGELSIPVYHNVLDLLNKYSPRKGGD